MKQVVAVTLNTFREAVRDKLLYAILFFAVVLLLFSLVLGELSLHEERRVVVDLGLSGISVMSVLLSIVLGVGMLHKEIDRKTLYPILSKPVARWQFVLGKYLGMVVTLLVQILFMTAIFAAILAHKGGSFTVPIALALYLAFLEVVVVTSIALFFSSFSTPYVSGVLTLGVFVVGRNVDLLETFMRGGKLGPAGRLLGFVPDLFPSLYLFFPSGRAIEEHWVSVHQRFIDFSYVAQVTGYGVLYAAACLLLSMVIFSRRDLL